MKTRGGFLYTYYFFKTYYFIFCFTNITFRNIQIKHTVIKTTKKKKLININYYFPNKNRVFYVHKHYLFLNILVFIYKPNFINPKIKHIVIKTKVYFDQHKFIYPKRGQHPLNTQLCFIKTYFNFVLHA